jgi:hypothetical protein
LSRNQELDDDELARTAYHEAGHCVIAVLCGATATRACIDPEEDNYFGQVDIEWPKGSNRADQIMTILAGPVAEMIYRSEPLHPGFVQEWAQDWKQAWAIARPKTQDDRSCLAMLEKLTAELYRTLTTDRYWSAIAAVQDLLLAHDEIEHEQIEYEVNAWLR